MKYSMKFWFSQTNLLVRGLDEDDMKRYAEKAKFEVPFEVTQPAMPNAWQALEEKTYIVNPNLVTHVEIDKENF